MGADEVVPDLVGVRTLVLLSVQKTDVCVRLSRKMVTVSEGRGKERREASTFSLRDLSSCNAHSCTWLSFSLSKASPEVTMSLKHGILS